MSKILVIANEWTTIVHFRMEILHGFLSEGYNVIVALPVCDEAQPIRDLGCELVNLDVSRHGVNPFQELKLFRQCREIIEKYEPDAVITYTVKPNVYGSYACRQTNTPYINNVTGVGTILQSKSAVAGIMLLMMKYAFKKSSCVFFQNRDNYQRFLSEGVVTEKTHVGFLPGSGVNLEMFSYVPYPSDGICRFVIVSRVRRDKGYSEFFDAAEKVKATHPEVEFHVIGWYEDEDLRQRIDDLKEKGIIVFHGSLPQEEVHRQVAACSCLVHPSYHEGMANVILESAATGRPVIASNICGCKEAVEDGITGYLCEAKNADSLADAIERFIQLSDKQRSEMGIAGRKKMEREFDRKIVYRRLLDEVERVLS